MIGATADEERSSGLRLASGTRELVGRIDIPEVGVSAVIVDGIDDTSLRRAVGLVPGTAWPGSDKKTAVAGHRDTYFRGLRNIEVGDKIFISMPGNALRYRVKSLLVVDPHDVKVLGPGDGVDLTLVTCYPFNYVGPAGRRFIVQAEQIGREADRGRDGVSSLTAAASAIR
jgi:sortase A